MVVGALYMHSLWLQRCLPHGRGHTGRHPCYLRDGASSCLIHAGLRSRECLNHYHLRIGHFVISEDRTDRSMDVQSMRYVRGTGLVLVFGVHP